MQYRIDKKGDKISVLGFGIMRIPRINGTREIDYDKSKEMIDYAYANGINYYDTAYSYDGGKNEEVLGQAVEPFRDKIKIATKLPVYGCRKNEQFDNFFNKSLSRLRTDYVDYYMLHSLIDYEQYTFLKNLGIEKWMNDKKESGQVKSMGFSFHGKCEDFKKIIDSYDWDFCQIQYNYWDIYYQAGREGLLYAASKGIPVIVMEPLRGGAIIDKQPQEALDIFKEIDAKRTMASWGLKWVFNHEQVLTVLSGMSTMEQLVENIEIADNTMINSLIQDESNAYERARLSVIKLQQIACTGCGYCMPCPYGVDIPACFSVYNEVKVFKVKGKRVKYISTIGGLSKNAGFASKCVKCGACESKCPQNLKIIDGLISVKKELELPFMKPVLKLCGKIFKKN